MSWFNFKDETRSYEVRESISRLFILVVTILLLTLTMTSLISDSLKPGSFVEGDVAKSTVRSPRDFLLEDIEGTEKRKKEARAQIKKVFVMNEVPRGELTREVEKLFSGLEELAIHTEKNPKKLVLGKDERINFERQFGINLVGEEWNILLNQELWPTLKDKIIRIVSPILRSGLLSSKRPLQRSFNENGAVLVRKTIDGEQTESVLRTDASFYDLSEAVDLVKEAIPESGFGLGTGFDTIIEKLATIYIQPNVSFDEDETVRRIIEAESEVSSIYVKVSRGEVIVRAGNLISAEQERKLTHLFESQVKTSIWKTVTGYILLTAVILVAIYYFAISMWPDFQPRNKDLAVIATTLVGSLFMLKLNILVGGALSLAHPDLVTEAFMLATPLAAGGIMLQVTLGSASVFLFLLSFSLLIGVYLEHSWLLFTLVVIGNIVAALSMKASARRAAFLIAGARIAAINTLIILCFFLIYPDQGVAELSNRILWSVIGGLLSGAFGVFLTPIAELIGGYVTDIKLLELASLDQPILKELSVQAPGTWNHSMVIGQIGEAAAESIGANSLLTRVGAYYHDIGKIKKPAYFVENQGGKENRHDKLAPSMSALIIKAHVKDGVEMAIEHRLPETITDFIPQHHGTSLISYFYDKAKNEACDDDIVEETHYRYGGPKPQTKEAGILMLADAVEASSRTLSDPTPAKIQGLVQKICNKIFVSGELEESNLTLKDLHLIARSFTRVLSGIYHRRIVYSEPAEKTTSSHGDKSADTKVVDVTKLNLVKKDDSRPSSKTASSTNAEESQSNEKEDKDSRRDAIKRLGMQ